MPQCEKALKHAWKQKLGQHTFCVIITTMTMCRVHGQYLCAAYSCMVCENQECQECDYNHARLVVHVHHIAPKLANMHLVCMLNAIGV